MKSYYTFEEDDRSSWPPDSTKVDAILRPLEHFILLQRIFIWLYNSSTIVGDIMRLLKPGKKLKIG
ncbi:hypothetical protein ONS96_011411 [Cadophora gregata f. sp. sojae]|nr:hypothetical protein ONS96_011411 [Cadophora gregata f. sp. sojae]